MPNPIKRPSWCRRVAGKLVMAAAFSAVLSVTMSAQQPLQLITGKKISPVGTNTAVGNLPMNMIKSPDGKYGIVSDMGFNQWLSSIDLKTGAVLSQVDFGQQPVSNSYTSLIRSLFRI